MLNCLPRIASSIFFLFLLLFGFLSNRQGGLKRILGAEHDLPVDTHKSGHLANQRDVAGDVQAGGLTRLLVQANAEYALERIDEHSVGEGERVADQEVAQLEVGLDAGKGSAQLTLGDGEGTLVHSHFGGAGALRDHLGGGGKHRVVDEVDPHVDLLSGAVLFQANERGRFLC